MPVRVMLIAGEASGDLHGSGVVRELRALDPGIELYGIGGENMRREGMDLIFHIRDLSFMGLAEVLKNLPTVKRVEESMRSRLESRRPDVVVLIDYPGFNLRFAKVVKRLGIPVLYYISPQVWAWHKSRVKTMRKLVDRMKVVFPFEVEIYRREGIDVEFVGHPVVEQIGTSTDRSTFCAAHGLDPARKILGLLPGSRLQEIDRILPVMAEAARRLETETGAQTAIGVAPNLGMAPIRRRLPGGWSPAFVEGATYDLMARADAVVVTSGTATLETGWFATPMVVVYKTSPLTFFVGRMLVDVPFIALANIVAGRKVVQELIQNDLTVERLVAEAGALLTDPARAAQVRADLSVIRERLGGPGASARVARDVLRLAEAA
jgi:lipid-A-disaccharide synthase